MSQDEIRLVIPAAEDFRRIAHLVTGGLALGLEATYDDLEDVQVAIEALLGFRDDSGEVTVVLSADRDVLRAAVGPLPADVLRAAEPGTEGLDLERVLETVCDTHEVDLRDDGLWVEVTKQMTAVAGSTGA